MMLRLGWWTLAVLSVATIVRSASDGDQWRTAGAVILLVLVVALRRELTEPDIYDVKEEEE